LVTHDPEVASRADRKIVLRDGLIVEDSLPYAGARLDDQAAQEALILGNHPEKPPSGAKALFNSAAFMYGLKPVPFIS
jgi:uncharacterized oligopeptide transporter (OPT) family protein